MELVKKKKEKKQKPKAQCRLVEAEGIAKFQEIVSKDRMQFCKFIFKWKGLDGTKKVAESPNAEQSAQTENVIKTKNHETERKTENIIVPRFFRNFSP